MKSIISSVILVLTCAFVGCDSNDLDSPSNEIAEISIQPDSASIEVGNQVDFSLTARSPSGEVIEDPALDINWWSSDSTIFTVTDDGLAIGQDSGMAYCIVETSGLSKSGRQFVGRDSAFVIVYLF